jgi:adenylate cyclase
MTEQAGAAPGPSVSAQSIGTRELRLVSGLVLGCFLTTHFLNHALGLVSLSAMESGRGWFNILWRSMAGTILLYGAILIHFALALVALYRRRTLRMPAREAFQLGFGLLLPFLIIPHVTGTRIVLAVWGIDFDYARVMQNISASPDGMTRQTAALLIAWVHFGLGIHFWLRSRLWYPRVALLLYSAALLVPVFALLGLAEAGKDLGDAAAAGGPAPVPDPATLGQIRNGLYLIFAGLIGATLAARALRASHVFATRIDVTYPNGQVVSVPRGHSVLEASRIGGIPHMSVCGGRGRCSTCRLRVLQGLEKQPPPSVQERATLKRIKATPNVRLACQLRPVDHLSVAPLLVLDERKSSAQFSRSLAQGGRECEIAVLFCDLRGFTSLAEHRLPYDTVFILNRFFDVVGHAVEESGGHVDKFIGDGALALFGLDGNEGLAARQALAAARLIGKGVAGLNASLGSELERPLRIAMGLHAGHAIVGEMGYGKATTLTAIGDSLNTASRLEGFAKESDAEVVVSDDLMRLADFAVPGAERQTVMVRGRSTPIVTWIIHDAASIAAPSMA